MNGLGRLSTFWNIRLIWCARLCSSDCVTLRLRDVVELCLLRGVKLSHETVRDWEQRFAPYLIDAVKTWRRGKCYSRWHVDETYANVKGQWVYLYQAIDRDGNLVDTMLSATRSKKAAIRFFKQAQQTTGVKPTCITTDKLASCRKDILKACGRKVVHCTNKYLNNRIEQDHRGIKRRYGPDARVQVVRLRRHVLRGRR